MAYRFGLSRLGGKQEHSDSCLQRDPNISPSTSWWANRKDCEDQLDSFREQLMEMTEHLARLQGDLRSERTKCSRLQLQCSHQEAELKRREMHCNRLKEKLSQLTDRHKGPSIEVLNFPPGSRGKREHLSRGIRSSAKREEAAMRLMLERREAELREAMKLRHSLTTLLHGLRVNMEQWQPEFLDLSQDGDKNLDETEAALGEHLTGGVIQTWRLVQKRLQSISSEGQTAAAATDHDKLLAQLELELKESQMVVRVQQQLLQDSLSSTVPSELSDSYFLEEWERLQMSWAELTRQKRTFERERQAFTDAAIRLSHERRDFDQQRALFLKQQYLSESPFNTGAANRRESTAFNFSGVEGTNVSGCLPITPSSSNSGNIAAPGLHEGRVRVQTPSTPQLYSALNLSYNTRSREADHHSEMWEGGVDRRQHTPWPSYLDWSF